MLRKDTWQVLFFVDNQGQSPDFSNFMEKQGNRAVSWRFGVL